jgi:hypothetical protein
MWRVLPGVRLLTLSFPDKADYILRYGRGFEIVGQITESETIAIGNSIRELSQLRARFGMAAGGSGKGLPTSGLLMVRYVWRKFIGTRRMASAK